MEGDTTMAEQDSVFEVLTRRPDGHETVHRFQAADEKAATDAAISSGVPADQIVEAGPELAPAAPEPATDEPDQEPKPEASDRPTKPERSH
jgi:hypothetical protein